MRKVNKLQQKTKKIVQDLQKMPENLSLWSKFPVGLSGILNKGCIQTEKVIGV